MTSPALSLKAANGLPALPAAATLGALGIVYGDIGTSPLYAFKEAIKAAGRAAVLRSRTRCSALSH